MIDFIMDRKTKRRLGRRMCAITNAIQLVRDAEHAGYALAAIRRIESHLEMAKEMLEHEAEKSDRENR